MKKWFLKNKWIAVGAIAGAIGGYTYYSLVGCSTGTCAITSNPIISTLYFGVMGGLFVSIILPNHKNKKESI